MFTSKWQGTTDFNDLRSAQESTDPAILESLSKSNDPVVRAAIAENSNTPFNVLFFLAQDNDTMVKVYLLRNKNLTIELLIMLLESNIPLVKREAHVTAIMKYREGVFDFDAGTLLSILKVLDPKADQISLIEAVEQLHMIREGSYEPKRLFRKK